MFRTIKYPLMEDQGEGGAGNGAGGDAGDAAGDAGKGAQGDAGAQGDGGQASWRATFETTDDKQKAWLERFTKPEDLLKTAWESQQRIRAGEVLKPLPKDATPEDVKAYREQQGIPAEPKGYFENVPEGLVIGEDDQPIFDTFAEKMHAINAPPGFVHEAIKWYNDFQQEQTELLVEADKGHANECSQVLRDEWGADYRANINISKALLSTMSEEAQKRFNDARTPEGKAFLNDPEIVKWMVNLGREVHDVATITGAGAGDDKTIDARITEIEGMMGTKAYTKNEAIQSEYRQLIEVREKRKQKAA